MSSVQRELDRLGRRIIEDAKTYARPNKKTGRLDSSLRYDTTTTGDDRFTLILEEVYYGKYLNNKTGFMDRAIDKNINDGIDSIIDIMIDDLTGDI